MRGDTDWFAIVDGKLCGELRHGGEYHAACPWCDKEAERGQTHFSYSTKGGHCFVCGKGGGLKAIAEQIDELPIVEYRRTRRVEKRTQVAYWKDDADDLLSRYESHSARFEAWQNYKPLQASTIRRMRLGAGVLPQSRCKHERLIVPIISSGKAIWFRGRAMGCDCGKWLASGGVRLKDVPLYNAEAVQPGSVVWIVENPIDALMITERTDYVGVATYSVSYWQESWADALSPAQWVIVAYDNDIPGNGGGENYAKFAAQWRMEHDGQIMEPNGPKLTNRLSRAGLPARLFEWPIDAPVKADIGSMMMSA